MWFILPFISLAGAASALKYYFGSGGNLPVVGGSAGAAALAKYKADAEAAHRLATGAALVAGVASAAALGVYVFDRRKKKAVR